jgi:pyocin large subunit-like protein
MATIELELIKQQSRKLPPEQKAELLHFLSENILGEPTGSEPRPLAFGKYASSNRPLSTDADFHLAEWRPSDEELNGR